ncbi:LuxR C-terminal-related transcriptional regulator, partial [Actinoplanes sp. NPDC049596]
HPDRRAWHRAQAAAGPDESVAAELEASAERARSRGGLAATAAFLERAAELTVDPAVQADRAVTAARAKYQAGDRAAAAALLARAVAGPPDDRRTAMIQLLEGQMAFASERSGDGPRLLLETARRLEPLDAALARDTYLDAITAALYAGRFASAGGLSEVAAAARDAPAAAALPRPADMLLDGLSRLYTEGYRAGVPLVRKATTAFQNAELGVEDALRWLYIACHSAHDIWDDDGWQALSARYVQLARETGALSLLPIALSVRIGMHLHAGEFAAASALVEEIDTITAATGDTLPAYGALAVAGWRGRPDEAAALAPAVLDVVAARGEGMGLTLVQHSLSVLHNGLGNFGEALAAAEVGTASPHETGFANWALPELVEAAAGVGDRLRARRALDRLAELTGPSGTEWSLGIEARCRALLTDGLAAEDHHREAIDRLGRSRGAVASARAHLMYGEWLRRQDRHGDARTQLRLAHDRFTAIGAEAFADRTRDELTAIGDRVDPRPAPAASRAELTPQERTIARRARDGRTNPEIGAELFLSARTVEWHLRKVYLKLGITRRRELRSALPAEP